MTNDADDGALQFVHLSDIHCTDRSGKGVFDLDADLRRAIEQDAADSREKLGTFTGIFITGDIAFAAAPEDYKKAADWIEKLERIIGSSREHTYMVPGNHDVQRNTTTDLTVAGFHKEIRTCELKEIDPKLESWLSEKNADNQIPYRALTNYNAFAKNFGCDISPPAPCWDATLDLPHGFTLGIRGLTSVFASNAADDTGVNKLVVGQAQATMPIERGRANLSLCHHPPDWFRDADTFQQTMLAGTHIQLYGHKHMHRVVQIDESVVVSAGAVHPERGDSWEPRYNAIRLTIDRRDEAYFLVATVYPKVFKADTRKMEPDYRQGRGDFREFRIELPPPVGPAAAGVGPSPTTAVKPDPTAATARDTEPGTTASYSEDGGLMHPLRRLGYLLAEIPDHRRETIARDCHLLVEDAETRATTAILIQRARDTDQLKALWDAAAEFAEDDTPNPFRGERSE